MMNKRRKNLFWMPFYQEYQTKMMELLHFRNLNSLQFFLLIFSVFFIFSCKMDNNKQSRKGEEKINLMSLKHIQHSLISKGDNFPDFNPAKDSIDYFLFSLHNKNSIEDFKIRANFSNKKMDEIISLLKTKNWIHYIDNKPFPSIFITTHKDGKMLFKYAEPLAEKIVNAIEKDIPTIKEKFNHTEVSKNQNFEYWSFLILSNVLLDSWQIENVEKEYLMKENRPLRHGKNYYYSIMENNDTTREVFGIYGNQYEENGNKTINIYGNNRIGITLHNSINKISKTDNEILKEIANNFKPKLINIFLEETVYIKEIYKISGYENEISFEEFFIWWYHFIYTEATNIMHKKGLLKVPNSGNFEYELEE